MALSHGEPQKRIDMDNKEIESLIKNWPNIAINSEIRNKKIIVHMPLHSSHILKNSTDGIYPELADMESYYKKKKIADSYNKLNDELNSSNNHESKKPKI